MKTYLIFFIYAVFTITAYGQEKPNIKFGKLNAADFILNSTVVDSNANAVVIADIGSCKFEGNAKGWFTLVFTEHKRIKILNKNGFDAANIEIGLYKYGTAVEKIENLKAQTYNLENKSVVEQKLDDKNVFDDRLNNNYLLKKFTFPGVKEGSIIEYSYIIKSDFLFQLHPWEFQGQYPCMWSEYTVSIPAIFSYILLKQGITGFYLNTSSEKNEVYSVTEDPDQYYQGTAKIFAVNTTNTIRDWAMKDIPAMPFEDFVFSNRNYISRLEFQLSEYRFPDEPVESKMKNWDMVTEELLKFDDFGKVYLDQNIAVNEELKNVTSGITNIEKAKNIYEYIRDNYTCTRNAGIYLSEDKSLNDIIKNKTGSVSDLNILLIAMLRADALNANPVILSTRSYGRVNPQYPIIDKFNYVLCQVKINNDSFYLDASKKYLGFKMLDLECYNGLARIITRPPVATHFESGDWVENKIIDIKIVNNNNDLTGQYTALLGNNESMQLRHKLSSINKDQYLKEEEKKYESAISINNGSFDSLKNYDAPLSIHYTINIKSPNEDIFLVNPLMSELITKNPFSSQQRSLPVELPYTENKIYNFSIEIPKGYKIDELPKPQTISLPSNAAKFDYQILSFTDHIQVRCAIQIRRTFFEAADYENLRQFYALIIKKENENIVFKKIQ